MILKALLVLNTLLIPSLLSYPITSVLERVIRTRVVILGGGMTGVVAAKTLHEEGIADFVLIEARHELGKISGRMQDVTLNNGINVELGANWVQGLGTQNPIHTLALENNLRTSPDDNDDIATFDDNGSVAMSEQLHTFKKAFSNYLAIGGQRILNQHSDLTARAGLSLTGYRPKTYLDDAAEYYKFDFEFAEPPEKTSFLSSAGNNNFTFKGFSDENNFVIDQRGIKVLAQATAAKIFMPESPDSRMILLNHTVTHIDYSLNGVTIHTRQGVIIEADYAICTFSVGVLQHNDVGFNPPLPEWKREAIYGMNMGIFTKIFLTFNTTFWSHTQYQIYADPSKRGYYTVWKSLDLPDMHPGSHTLFSTVIDQEAIRVERQDETVTQAQMMRVLRSMYGPDIPEPTQIMFKRWYDDPLFRGSFSSWGTSYPPAMFDSLRAPLETRLWFAGEATSFKYYGYLQGAYTEGQSVAMSVIQCISGNCSVTADTKHATVPAYGKTFLEELEDPTLIYDF